MSLLDKASLIVTPNAYKESKLYSVVPSSGAGDMDVVRATTATRVNSAGLIEVVPRNLFTYSEQFDNAAWTKINATVTANATTAPNGMLTADKLIATAVSGLHVALQTPTGSISGENFTTSIFVKASGLSRITLLNNQGGGGIVDYNLTTGTFTLVSGVSASIQSLDNGWYRCIMTFTPNSTGNFNLQVRLADSSGNTTFTGNGVDGVFVWGFQVEQGSTATEYFPTTTRLNIPRIDYTNGSCPSLLVEPQRTNLITYSQNLNTNWVKSASTVETNSIISPDGTQNATKLNVTTSGYSGLYQLGNSSVAKFSSSIFAKKGNKDWLYFVDANGSANVAFFNLSNGTLGTVSNGTAKIEDYGNGWYRCTYSDTNNVTNSYFQIGLSDANNSTLPSSSGYGYVWGAQREVGSYATSYIPTVASSVTRNADVISKTGISSLIGQTEGTLFADFVYNGKYGSVSNGAMPISIDDASGNNEAYIFLNGNNNTAFGQFVVSGGFTCNITGLVMTVGTRYKMAFAYKQNDFAFYINGILQGVDTSGNIAALPNLRISNYFSGNYIHDNINSAQLYKTRLSNSELASLTSL